MTAAFQLDGQDFVALNGGPRHKLSEAISFVVNCETQAEVDRFWDQTDRRRRSAGTLRLAEGQVRSLLADRPTILPKLLSDKDPAKSGRAMAAMMKMSKLDGEALSGRTTGPDTRQGALRKPGRSGSVSPLVP